MEEQLDYFTQKRTEVIIDIATKKLQNEINTLKEGMLLLNKEIGSLKSQVSRLQSQQQQQPSESTFLQDKHLEDKKVDIVDCRPQNERKEQFVSGATRNSDPVRPRYGDYKTEDVSIEKFFYFGRK